MRVTPSNPDRREGLPKALILSHRGWIRTIFEKGKRWNHGLITLLTYPRPQELKATVAFLSPKKVGGAVERNRIRRRMREAYRRRLHQPESPFLLVWLPRPAASKATFEEIAEAMTHLIQKSQGKS